MRDAHVLEYSVSFGDCDPAGIVFYPRTYAWFDRAFHDWLRNFGGHGKICQTLGAVGIGLLEAKAQFRRPMRDGDRLRIALSIEEWGRKTLRLGYEITVAGEVAAVGGELRGLFKPAGDAIVASEIEVLRQLLGEDG
ncbi:4-hydroxybenzoyl-CoA thioesterase [Rhizobium sp. M10]|nr:4-hydroxybenzoyl-CoA thioesterase [Rhizobium sp. M10]